MINVKNLTIVYPDGTKALTDVTFSIKKGERVAVVGGNGAGKSTLMLSIMGVLPISLGAITVNNLAVTPKTLAELRKQVGMVFQNPDDQLFMPKVYDDVAFAPRNYGLSEPETTTRVAKALESLGITYLANRMPQRLSGGEKRRVAIAGILAMETEAILMDEPTSFLDPRSRRQLIETLKELPHTQLIATHDLDMVNRLCDRVIVLQDGIIKANGLPSEILTDKTLLEL